MSKSAYCSVAGGLPRSLRVAVPLAFPLLWVSQGATHAVTFSFDFGGTAPNEIQRAAEEAADLWSPLLKDDAIVNIRVDYADLSAAGSVLGGAQPGKVKVKYEDYTQALFKDATSSNDFLGVSNLQLSAKGREAIQEYQIGEIDLADAKLESKEFSFLIDGQFAKGKGKGARKPWQSPRSDFLDDNGNDNNKHMQLTRAQAKSLGLLNARADELDAVITINNKVSWDFDRIDGVDSNSYDAVSVLQHEIGHALGIVSGVDTMDFLTAVGGPDEFDDIEKNPISYLTPIDFYRYSEESARLGVVDLTIGDGEKYFSLDGGRSAVKDEFGRAAYFSTGSVESGGDGYQGSHWKLSENPLGVMNPILQPGKSVDISELDLTLLDTTGWDLEDSTAERAARVGVDWSSLSAQLSGDRQTVIDELELAWGYEIPELEAAVNDASFDLEFKFQQKLQEKLDKLTEKLGEKTDLKKRNEEIAKFYSEVEKEASKRDKEIRKLPKDIYKTDETVRKWLRLPTDELSKEMEKADTATINRLSNVVKSLPDDERASIESKIEQAVAAFSDESDKLVEDLLKTSGPANPIGWSYYRWYWWWLEGEAVEADSDFYYYQAGAASGGDAKGSTVLPFAGDRNISTFSTSPSFEDVTFENVGEGAKDIPEPSSVLAMFGVAVLGANYLRSRAADKQGQN